MVHIVVVSYHYGTPNERKEKQMISERTIRNWRLDALVSINNLRSLPKEGINTDILRSEEKDRRILRLTQEMLDQALLRRAG
jgi:hypothetical protein